MTVETRIFMGFLYTKEVKKHLQQSHLWNEAKLIGSATLIEIQYEGKRVSRAVSPLFSLLRATKKS